MVKGTREQYYNKYKYCLHFRSFEGICSHVDNTKRTTQQTIFLLTFVLHKGACYDAGMLQKALKKRCHSFKFYVMGKNNNSYGYEMKLWH